MTEPKRADEDTSPDAPEGDGVGAASANSLAAVRALSADSAARLPLPDAAAADAALRPAGRVGPLGALLYDEIRALLASAHPTGFDTHDLRRLGAESTLAQAIDQGDANCDAVIDVILSGLEAGTQLPPLTDPVWPRAMDLGRGLVAIGTYRHHDDRLSVVAAAGTRLARDGYGLAIEEGAYTFSFGDIERATNRIQSILAQFGQIYAYTQLFRILRETDRFAYNMYLPVRQYSQTARQASYPFGFLINLAAKLPAQGSGTGDPNGQWREALDLARDVVAALNLEPYNAFTLVDPAPRRFERLLREAALFDHVFAIRQWPFERTAAFLRAYFADDHRDVMQERLGWTVADVLTLLRALKHFANRDPSVFTIGALCTGGIPRVLLNSMLPWFAHQAGTANAGYDSPLAAERADLMFKPLLRHGPDHLLLPAAPLAGPAFYEAAMAALRSVVSADAANRLAGDGTERVVAMLLREAGLSVTSAGAAYDLGPDSAGECDFVVESATQILLVECKAKPLTRGTMAGVHGDALLDFAGGMFAAQAQALRHERILRTRGQIDFLDGTPSLVRGDRDITRLSVTLLDHGALQDRLVLWSLYEGLIRSTVTMAPEYKKANQARKFARLLDEMRREADALETAGISTRRQALAGASLSVGSLAVLLTGVVDLSHFIKRATICATYMSFNPVFEFHHMHASGLVQ